MNLEKNIEIRNKLRNDLRGEYEIEYFYSGEEEIAENVKRLGKKVKLIKEERPKEKGGSVLDEYDKDVEREKVKREKIRDLKLGEGRTFCFFIEAMGTNQVKTKVSDIINYPFVIYFLALSNSGSDDRMNRGTIVVSDSPNEDTTWPPIGDNIAEWFDGYENIDGFKLTGNNRIIEMDVYYLALKYPSYIKFVVSSLYSPYAPGNITAWVSIREILTRDAAKKVIIPRAVVPKEEIERDRKGKSPRGKVNWPKWNYGWLNEPEKIRLEAQGDTIVEELGPKIKYWWGTNFYCRWRKKLPVAVY